MSERIKMSEHSLAAEQSECKTTTLTVHAYNWDISPGLEPGDQDIIYGWCLDRESKPYLLRFEDFPAFCYVELPLYINNNLVDWNATRCNEIYTTLCNLLQDDRPTSYRLEMKAKAYYYKMDQKYPMLLMTFPRLASATKMENKLKYEIYTPTYGKIKLNVWETDIPPVRKLLSTRNVKFSQWFTIEGQLCTHNEGNKIGTIENEYIVKRSTMNPVSPETSKSWVTKPKILSMDIETYNPNHKAMPKPDSHEHDCWCVTLLCKQLNAKTTTKYAIAIGKCPDIDGAIVISVKTELDLIREMERIVNKEDPDIIIGYNIFMYDIPYLNTRLKRNIEDWGCIGRLSEVPAFVKTKIWESSAYGIQHLNMLNIPGRILIDLYPVIQRDYKLDMYTLDFVSNKFIKKRKHDVKPAEMFVAYEEMKLAIEAYNQFCESNNINLEYNNNIDKEIRKNIKVELLKEFNEIWQQLETAKIKFKKVTEYCIQDSDLVIGLMEQLNVWIGLIELSNIVGVTLVELFTSGQQIRCISQLYDLAFQRGIVLDKSLIKPDPNLKFAGGAVMEPQRGLHIFIICLDFASLYPSIQQAYNICMSTFIHPDLDKLVPDDMCNVVEFDQEEDNDGKNIGLDNQIPAESEGTWETDETLMKIITSTLVQSESEYDGLGFNEDEIEMETKVEESKTITKHYKFRFIKAEYFMGLIPQLVKELVAQRNYVRKDLMKPLLKDVKKLEIQLIDLEIQKVSKYVNDNKKIKHYKELLSCEDKKLKKKNENVLKAYIEEFKNYEFTDEEKQIIKEIKLKKNDLELMLVVLDKRQLALKISANSFFGLLGIRKGGRAALIQAAMAITATGRRLIGEVNNHIKTKYADRNASIVYGDTDSTMADLGITDAKDCFKYAQLLLDDINGYTDANGKRIEGLFPHPLRMEFEKAMIQLCLEPKLYAYVEVDEFGNVEMDDPSDIKKKGIYSARRGNSKWATETYNNLLFTILNRQNIVDAFNLIVDAVIKLITNKVKWEDLVVIRGVGQSYKSDSFYMKIFSDELKKIGVFAAPGSRIQYVVCKNGEETLLGKRMKCIEDFLENKYEIDSGYYLSNVLQNPLDKLFKIGYNRILPKLNQVGYKPNSRKHFVSIENPIKMISLMLEDDIDISVLKKWMLDNYNTVMGLNIPKVVEEIKVEEQKEVKRIQVKLNIVSDNKIKTVSDGINTVQKIILN
jgi:DNA polymerase elongation subunit (family B)